MAYHKTVDDIKDLLTKNGIEFETFEHEPVGTSEEAAKIRSGYTLEQGAKALIIKTKHGFVMLVMPAHLRMDSKKVKAKLNLKDLRFATPEEVIQVTDGIQVGGVPPFGTLFNIPVYVDPKLFHNDRIVFNAGDRRYSIALKSSDYRKVVKFEEADITE